MKTILFCTNCTTPFPRPGSYCDVTALTAPVDLCMAGFYCVQGSDNQEQFICPAGRYCPEGTSVSFKCPSGTFSNDTRLVEEAECRNCTAGYYCQQMGLSEEEALCTAGYYCPEGMWSLRISHFLCAVNHVEKGILNPHCTTYSYLCPQYSKQCLISACWSLMIPVFLC